MNRRSILSFLMIFTLGLVGCGGGGEDRPEVVPAKGRLVIGSDPVKNADVVFYPEAGGKPASGSTNDNGEFTLSTFGKDDGAPIGKHKVAVNPKGPASNDADSIKAAEAAKSQIPEAANKEETTTITVEVKAGTEDLGDIEVK